MDRSLSVDDFNSGIWRLGQASIARNDSDSHFADLLKSFPSTNSLGAEQGSNSQPGDAHPNPEVSQQARLGGEPGAQPQALTPPRHAGSVPEQSIGMGMPRVASLEVIKQFLVAPQHLAQTPAVHKKEPGLLPFSSGVPAQSMPQMDLSTLPNVLNAGGLAALSAMPGLQAAGVNQNALLAAGLNPAAAAAAALQLSQISGLAPHVIDRDALEKEEQRRARRMLSNRESARRSRRRKQEHLTNMEIEISELAEDKRKWTEMRESLERRCESAEEESRKLREENSRLRDELRILGLVREELADQRRCIYRHDGESHFDEADVPLEKRRKGNGEMVNES